MTAGAGDAAADVELAARESYGRLLAWLTSRCGSIAMAEDALADALSTAVQRWPDTGVPDNPEAWLLTVARRRLIDEQRRLGRKADLDTRLRNEHRIRLNLEAAEANEMPLRPGIPERRLELLFMCAHPDIPEVMRTPLMLQTVLGLTAEQIGSAMLVAPRTIAQRLVRVKRRIEAASIPFEVPPDDELPDRVGHVLDAVYAAYNSIYDTDADTDDGTGSATNELSGSDVDAVSSASSGLAGEAIWLAGLLVQLLPDDAEAKGLYALLCLCEARRPARWDEDGRFIPLDEQDPSRWDRALIESGEIALWRAADAGRPGRYQTEAAIHSIHADRTRTGRTDWPAIERLYELLVAHYPTLGATIGHAAAIGRTGELDRALALLDGLDRRDRPDRSGRDRIARHQPYWAVRAWLLSEQGRSDAAADAYDRAVELAVDPGVRAWLVDQRRRRTG